MKRLILCLLAALLLTGCNLRNRQDSRNFIPTGGSKEETRPVVPSSSAKEEDPPILSSPVKEIKALEGSYVYGGETIEYKFYLPYLDLSGAHAVGCNAEIEEGYGEPIRAAEKAMENRELPALREVDYETWQYGDVLCLLIYRVETESGERHESLYTVNARTGGAVTAEEVLTAAGMTEEAYRERLHDAVAAFYEQAFTPFYDPEDFHYIEGLNGTLELLNTAAPASVTKQGVLVAAVNIVEPSGVTSAAQVEIPAD